ncbi:MAG: carboxypeptidase-like regulatory domain-containing protein [Bacteroidota bacterium]
MKETLLLVCCFLAVGLWGQTTLIGQVTDPQGQPIFGVNVYDLDDPTAGVITNLDGQYQLVIQDSTRQLVFSFIGYRSDTLDLKMRKNLHVLQPQTIDLRSITVSATDPIAEQFAATQLDKLDIYLSPVAQGDPLKAITGLPFSTNTDESANPVLRGSSADRSRVVFNGVPIYEPVRSSQLNNQGFFSLFNPAIIDQMTVFPSNPPLIYGNSSAGLVDIRTVNRLEREELQVSTGLATAGVFAAKKIRESEHFIQVYGNYQFDDGFIGLNRPNLPRLRGFRTADLGLNLHVSGKHWSWNSFHYAIDEGYEYLTAQFTFEGLARADKRRYFQVNNLQWKNTAWQVRLDQGLNWSQSAFVFGNLHSSNRTHQWYEAIQVKWLPDQRWSIQFGMNHEWQTQRFQDTIPAFYYAFSPESPSIPSFTEIGQHNLEAHIFAKLETKKWGTWQTAIRSNWPIQGLNHFLSTQLTWNLQPTPQHRILLGAGRYHNFSTSNFFSQLFALQSSDQVALDYRWKRTKIEMNAAIFWKQEQVEPGNISGFNISSTNTLGLEYGLSGSIGNHVSWSCSNVFLHQRIQLNDQTFIGDQSLAYFIRGSLEFKHPKWFNLALTWQHRPGNRFTPIVNALFNPSIGFYEPIFSDRWNGQQLAGYQRLDLTMNRFLSFRRFDLITFLTVGNLLNRSNERGVVYSPNYQVVSFDHFQLRTLYFGVVWQFH